MDPIDLTIFTRADLDRFITWTEDAVAIGQIKLRRLTQSYTPDMLDELGDTVDWLRFNIARLEELRRELATREETA